MTYVADHDMWLPKSFGGLSSLGDGVVAFRFGAETFVVTVRQGLLTSGWSRFAEHAKLENGSKMLLAHSCDNVVSILRFEKGMGMNSTWILNAVQDIPSQLFEETTTPPESETEICRTACYPPYMHQLFSCPSGTRVFKLHDYLSMKIPTNLANILEPYTEVVIRNGTRTWNVAVGMDYFRGPEWSALTENCRLMVGVKLYFFRSYAEELEMIIIGTDGVEVVFDWARCYHRSI